MFHAGSDDPGTRPGVARRRVGRAVARVDVRRPVRDEPAGLPRPLGALGGAGRPPARISSSTTTAGRLARDVLPHQLLARQPGHGLARRPDAADLAARRRRGGLEPGDGRHRAGEELRPPPAGAELPRDRRGDLRRARPGDPDGPLPPREAGAGDVGLLPGHADSARRSGSSWAAGSRGRTAGRRRSSSSARPAWSRPSRRSSCPSRSAGRARGSTSSGSRSTRRPGRRRRTTST